MLVEQLALREGISGSAARAVPLDAGRLVIMRSSQLEAAQIGVRVVRALSYVLSVLALALYALAVYVAGRGRRSATVLGIGWSSWRWAFSCLSLGAWWATGSSDR